jgi:hypothetical protein
MRRRLLSELQTRSFGDVGSSVRFARKRTRLDDFMNDCDQVTAPPRRGTVRRAGARYMTDARYYVVGDRSSSQSMPHKSSACGASAPMCAWWMMTARFQ